MRNGARWWWVAVGRERHALGLDEGTAREEAYRLACARFGANEIARDPATGEATLDEVLATFAGEQAQRYKPRSWSSIEYRLAAFTDWMKAHAVARPSQITDALVARWISAQRERSLSNATINRAIVVARVCFRWAAARTPPLCRPTVLERVRDLREVGRTRHPIVPSPDEWRRVVAMLVSEPAPVRCGGGEVLRSRHVENARGLANMVAAAVETGLRFDELRHLREEDIDATVVNVRAHAGWQPKSWEERSVPVSKATADTARRFVRWRAAALGLNGRAIALGDHYVLDAIASAWARGGLPDEPPGMHDCRRTFATACLRTGFSLDRVRVLLGHRDVSTTERYIGRYRSDVEHPVSSLGVVDVLVGLDV